jgi:hypothetical protein
MVAFSRGFATTETLFVNELASGMLKHELLAKLSVFEIESMCFGFWFWFFALCFGLLFYDEAEPFALLAPLAFAGFAFFSGPEPRAWLVDGGHWGFVDKRGWCGSGLDGSVLRFTP